MDLAMENDRPPPYVQYHSGDASVQLIDADQGLSQASPKVSRKRRCSSVKALTIALMVCLSTTLAALTFLFLHPFGLSPKKAEQFKSVALPDVTNLNLVSANNHYLTLAWDQPEIKFDYYWLEVSGGNADENGSLDKRRPSSCGNGTIIRPEQTRVTCGPFDACSSVNVTVRTYSRGPPELTSTGTTIRDLFIDSQEASEPRNIIMMPKSPTMTRLQWEEPTRLEGTLDVYKVKVCRSFATCNQKQSLSGCLEYEASDGWLDISSTPDTKYCVVITAITRCGRNFKTSLPSIQEIQTPLFGLPDVSHLAVNEIKSGYVTLSWQRPRGRFDYYSIQVTEHTARSTKSAQKVHGLCANGTIVHPEQTEITCGPFEPCSNVSCTVRTLLNEPPQHVSPGATITGIFIPVEDQTPPTNVTMVPESPSRTRLHWSRPKKIFGTLKSYIVTLCKTLGPCDTQEMLSDCTEQMVTETETVFDTKVDTSYCVHIATRTLCGSNEIISRQVNTEIRTPLFAQPEVTNLQLSDVGTDTFALTWERHSTCFDYYTVEVTDKNSNSSSGVTCNNGTEINSNQTSVTCEQTETCSNVTIRVKTHTRGPPPRSGTGAILTHVFLLGKAPPEPTNLKLVSAKGGNFTATFKVQDECYDNWYSYQGDASKSSVNVLYNDICNFYPVAYNQRKVICTGIQACDKLDLKIWTLRKGPPERTSSIPAVLRSIDIRGNC